MTHDFKEAKEYMKCRISSLYFIEKYIKIPVAGGLVTMEESDLWNATPKYKDFVKLSSSPYVDNIEILFSRQHGKTTTIAMMMLYYMMFYSRVPIQFLTLSKDNALDVIDRIKFMHDHLPKFLKVPIKGKGDKKTYVEFANGSKLNTRYVSGNINPDQIGRGFSTPLAWVDEAAFIPHMDIVWGAMQPALSAARVHAKRNNFPTKIFLSTTPNGAGTNWFYNMWQHGWEYEDIFDLEKREVLPNAQEILNSKEDKNNFARVRIHWSETGKTDEWYQQQVKELNFDMRRVNQEINLVFLGSSNAVFPDEVLEIFQPQKIINTINLAYGEKFNLFQELDPNKMYLLGVDTAASTAAKADYSAMVLVDAESGAEVGEWHGKFSVVKRFANVVKSLILQLSNLYSFTPDNLKTIIERNSFGLGTIEEIIYDDTFDYENYIYYGTVRSEKVPGLNTNKQSREMMFNQLLSLINEVPERASGPLLQEELRNLEQRANGRYEAIKGSHDDVVMAYNFCLYVRHELIQQGVITTKDTPTALRMDASQIKSYMDITFSTTTPSIKSTTEVQKIKKAIHSQDKFLFENIMDEKEEKQKRREILKEYAIPGVTSIQDEETGDISDYLIF